MTRQDTIALLDEFAAAWNAHDPDRLMACMVPGGGAFHAAAGSGSDGAVHEGADAVRAGYAAIFAAFPDAAWLNPVHIVDGNRAVTTWTFTGTRADGSRVEVRGLDVFVIADGKLAIKDTFRKQIV